jgi:hypothetical protein
MATISEGLHPNEVHQLKLAAAQDARTELIKALRRADEYCASGQPILARRYLGEALKMLTARQ